MFCLVNVMFLRELDTMFVLSFEMTDMTDRNRGSEITRAHEGEPGIPKKTVICQASPRIRGEGLTLFATGLGLFGAPQTSGV